MSPMPNDSDDDATPECTPKRILHSFNDVKETADNNVVPNNLAVVNTNVELNNTVIANGNENKENQSDNVLKKVENRLPIDEMKTVDRSYITN